MPTEKTRSCAVCGASNPVEVRSCGSCGADLMSADERRAFDNVLEDLIAGAPRDSEPAPVEDGSLDVEEEVVDELLDSLRIEGKSTAAALRIECPMCGEEVAAEALRCDHCGTAFEEVELEAPAPLPTQARDPAAVVTTALAPAKGRGSKPAKEDLPVTAVPTEPEPRRAVFSARLVDLVVGGTSGALVAVFIVFRLYSWSEIMASPLPLAMFLGVAAGGTVLGGVVFRLSTSYLAQGDRLVKLGRYQDAVGFLDRAIRMGHRPSNAWTSKGVALKRLGRVEEAMHCQRMAVRIDPENEIAWCNLGDLHFRAGDLPKALEAYDKALEIRPKYAIAWNNKGATLARLNRFEEARECSDRAVRLQPKYVVAWLNRGEVLARLGDRDEAQRCLERARALGA